MQRLAASIRLKPIQKSNKKKEGEEALKLSFPMGIPRVALALLVVAACHSANVRRSMSSSDRGLALLQARPQLYAGLLELDTKYNSKAASTNVFDLVGRIEKRIVAKKRAVEADASRRIAAENVAKRGVLKEFSARRYAAENETAAKWAHRISDANDQVEEAQFEVKRLEAEVVVAQGGLDISVRAHAANLDFSGRLNATVLELRGKETERLAHDKATSKERQGASLTVLDDEFMVENSVMEGGLRTRSTGALRRGGV